MLNYKLKIGAVIITLSTILLGVSCESKTQKKGKPSVTCYVKPVTVHITSTSTETTIDKSKNNKTRKIDNNNNNSLEP